MSIAPLWAGARLIRKLRSSTTSSRLFRAWTYLHFHGRGPISPSPFEVHPFVVQQILWHHWSNGAHEGLLLGYVFDFRRWSYLCRAFLNSLEKDALVWFHRLNPHIVPSSEYLLTEFVRNYLLLVEEPKTMNNLFKVIDRLYEIIKIYIERFEFVLRIIVKPNHVLHWLHSSKTL